MSVVEIKKAISELPPQELEELLRWLDERAADAWDEQIARDAAAGRFDAIVEKVRAQRKAGLSLPVVPGTAPLGDQ